MRNESKKPQGLLRSFSSYLKIVSNGASNVASTVKSAGVSVANSIADRDDDSARDQVYWSGFDKLECENGTLRQILMLGYRSGFQVWDVETADDVRQLVSRHDGPVSFLQMLRKPISTKSSQDNFSDVRPLLAVVGDASLSGNTFNLDGKFGNQELGNENALPTFVRFYSLKTHDYVHDLKFRTAVYSVRCSNRIIAISQAAQIHCFNAGTFEREYTILTCPIMFGGLGSSGVGYGPLSVGPRWLAYSGYPVIVSNVSRVTPQHLSSATSLSHPSSNGSLVTHYAKESSKQIAAGIVTLGDIGYKKLSKYYSEYVNDGNGYVKNGSSHAKVNGTTNGHVPDMDSSGMVIVCDIVLKSVVVQFRAHRSPIAALCFDPSGTLLVTASINGHNINVFRIMPSQANSSDSNTTGNSIHLCRLQRGITNAVIQDVSFSDDSQWIMISSSRGTSHLFSVSDANLKVDMSGSNDASIIKPHSSKIDIHSLNPLGNPITLSAASRIRNSNGWKNTVTGAAAAATGRVSPLSGAIASVFHNCKGSGLYPDMNSSRTKYYLLVFSPTGSVVQYVLKHSSGEEAFAHLSRLSTVSNGVLQESDSQLVVEALQKWDICYKKNRRDRGDFGDVYTDHENGESSKLLQKGTRKGTSIYPADSSFDTKVKHTSSSDENHHMYISEVELQMHAAKAPLWAKPEMYFQVMMDANITESDYGMGGEIEIERIPFQTIEARSKELIPVFDHLQWPKFQPSRNGSLENKKSGTSNGLLTYQKSGSFEEGMLLRKSSSSSLGQMSDSSSVNNFQENFPPSSTLDASLDIKDESVNNSNDDNQDMNTLLEHVNNREGVEETEASLERVNSMEALNLDSHFMDDDNEVD